MTATEDRFAGCLVGQCIGDAVGFMVEGREADACRRHADAVLFDRGAGEYARGPFALGQYSDDSQLARELIISSVDRRGFDPEDYARRIAALFAEGRVVGGGWSTAEAAARLASGTPWHAAGTPAPAAGNGSAMRAAPIGLMFHDDPAALVAAARDQGRITHADPRCSAGAIAIAGAVAEVMDGGPLDPSALIETVAAWATEADAGVGEALRQLPQILALPPHAAVGPVIDAARPDVRWPDQGPDIHGPAFGISPFVTSSVLWSLYAVLRTPDDYRQAIHTAIVPGGDVDTTAAMTGAIAGARNGLRSLPQTLAHLLNDRGAWQLGDLVELSHRLWRLKAEGGNG